MNRLLYENSVSYGGTLIIPFVFNQISGEFIYSYRLLSEYGHRSSLHQSENPSGLYSSSIEGILEIAKHYIDTNVTSYSGVDYFRDRYTYRNNLIIVHTEGGKCFYDHYPPDGLRNIAAPKLFISVHDCLNWVKQGIRPIED